MAALVWADVTGAFPVMADVPVGMRDTLLGHVNTALSVSLFGGDDGEAGMKLRLARIYLASHFGSLLASGGTQVGDVSSESLSADNYSLDFAQVSSLESLRSTPYGRLYLGLARTTLSRLPFVI